MTRIIYDLGANRGQNIDYYLLKADRVVAVEANPVLAQSITEKFVNEIALGRLIVVNAVVTIDCGSQVPFYMNHVNDVLSQLDPPANHWDFTQIELDAVNIIDLIDQYGEPWYIKIDLEHYDTKILTALFAYNIKPPFISAEIHNNQVLDLLYRAGGYREFKYMCGHLVGQGDYETMTVVDSAGQNQSINYEIHSAGPMGEDIPGPWLTREELEKRHDTHWNFGWVDIHCKRT